MRIINKKKLIEFLKRHPEAEQVLLAWHREVEQADWSTPSEVKERFPKASIVGSDRVVFRVRGARYRIIVQVYYPDRLVDIRFVGSHSQYERVSVGEV